MNDATITIFRNPACGTSRNTLALIRNSGVEPVIVEYLKTPPGRAKLIELVAAMGVPVRDVLRQTGTPYDEPKLDDPKWTDAQLIDFMVQHPILMNRPIVVTPLVRQAGALFKSSHPIDLVVNHEHPCRHSHRCRGHDGHLRACRREHEYLVRADATHRRRDAQPDRQDAG